MLDRDEYIQWVRHYDNGLHVSRSVGAYEFDLQYQPSEYVALMKQKAGSSGEISDQSISSDAIQYYLLTIGHVRKNNDLIEYGASSVMEKQKRLYYFSYQFQDYLFLEEGGERLPCVLYHFERTANQTGSRKVLLGFEKTVKVFEEATLVITSEYFGSLPVRIKISKAHIPDVRL